jgi:hypothetical protein
MKFKSSIEFYKFSASLNSTFIKKALLAIFLGLMFNTVQAQVIYSSDFNNLNTWDEEYSPTQQWKEMSGRSNNAEVLTNVSLGKFGTVDIANTTYPSDGLKLQVENSSGKNWSASLSSGLLAVKNSETNLGKLTLSFDHSISSIRPILVQLESFDTDKKRTGGLQKIVYPATINHFMRSAFELSEMVVFGDGKFNPAAPFVSFSFEIGGTKIDTKNAKIDLRIDNFAFSSPAYYVSLTGKDTNDGRTEKTAFSDVQKALDVAKAGDIILLMEGKYSNNRIGHGRETAVASFKRAGTPAAWVTLKNYPKHHPVILCNGRDGVRISQGSRFAKSESPLLAYIEVRGLHIRGNADEVPKLFPNEIGKDTPNTETKGVFISAKMAPTRMYHHIKISECLVEYCGTDGIWASEVDYLTVENNIIRNNCFTTIGFAMSGLSIMMYADFDKLDNITKIVVRNNQVYGNQRKVFAKSEPLVFNGNGMLFDASREVYLKPDAYLGRTLVQNNLVYGNGGGGIQSWGAHRLDIVNNTIYHNGITPELKWGNLGFDYCQDFTVINNIVVALPDRPLDRWMVGREDKDTSNIMRINNLYFGGAEPHLIGSGDIVADPLFVNPNLDPSVADFRLKKGSPAINSGSTILDNAPLIDLFTKNRTIESAKIDRGAIKFEDQN